MTDFEMMPWLEAYAAALAGNAEALAGFYAVSCLIAADRQRTAFSSTKELIASFESLQAFYNQHGICRFEPVESQLLEAHAHYLNLSVRWRYANADDEARLIAQTTYLLQKIDGHWKIIAVATQNEADFISR